MYGRFFPRALFGLLVIVGIAGLGFYAYQMGVAQGIAQGAPAGAAVAAPGAYMYSHHLFFAPFWGLGCLIPLFLLFLVFGGMRAMFWRGHMMGHDGWRDRWAERGVPPFCEEWHNRAHEKAETSGEPKPEGKASKA